VEAGKRLHNNAMNLMAAATRRPQVMAQLDALKRGCSMSTSNPLIERLTGKWHLLDSAADELQIPQHRMDLVFDATGSCLKGAILSRIDAKEFPLAVIEFEGATLRLQMEAPNGKSQADMPWLVMTLAKDKFEGYWLNSATKATGPKLKLIRAHL